MKYLAIDLQNDFIAEGGVWYEKYSCTDFVKNEFVPYCLNNNQQICEIISDYELPRLNGSCSYCVPETWGYESIIPQEILKGEPWIKATRSPNWIREKKGQFPIAKPDLFSRWLFDHLAEPDMNEPIVLLGVALDCCVLSVAQELYIRGYKIRFLYEGVDFSYKENVQKNSFIKDFAGLWGTVINWRDIK